MGGVLPTTSGGGQVIFTVVFAWTFLGGAVGWDRAAGSAATVAGVYVVSRAKERERRSFTSTSSGVAKGTPPGKGSSGGHARATPRTSIDLGVTVVLRVDDDAERGTTPKPNGSGSIEMVDEVRVEDEEERDGDGAPLLQETKL